MIITNGTCLLLECSTHIRILNKANALLPQHLIFVKEDLMIVIALIALPLTLLYPCFHTINDILIALSKRRIIPTINEKSMFQWQPCHCINECCTNCRRFLTLLIDLFFIGFPIDALSFVPFTVSIQYNDEDALCNLTTCFSERCPIFLMVVLSSAKERSVDCFTNDRPIPYFVFVIIFLIKDPANLSLQCLQLFAKCCCTLHCRWPTVTNTLYFRNCFDEFITQRCFSEIICTFNDDHFSHSYTSLMNSIIYYFDLELINK